MSAYISVHMSVKFFARIQCKGPFAQSHRSVDGNFLLNHDHTTYIDYPCYFYKKLKSPRIIRKSKLHCFQNVCLLHNCEKERKLLDFR